MPIVCTRRRRVRRRVGWWWSDLALLHYVLHSHNPVLRSHEHFILIYLALKGLSTNTISNFYGVHLIVNGKRILYEIVDDYCLSYFMYFTRVKDVVDVL